MRQIDPLLAYQFSVKVDGGPVLPATVYFSEIDGLSVDYTAIEYKTFSKAHGEPMIQNIPGRPTYTPVNLKRGITTDLTFWQWHHMVYEGKIKEAKATVTITLHGRASKPAFQWTLEHAWPVKITGPRFGAESNDVVMEELVLVYERITMQTPASAQ